MLPSCHCLSWSLLRWALGCSATPSASGSHTRRWWCWWPSSRLVVPCRNSGQSYWMVLGIESKTRHSAIWGLWVSSLYSYSKHCICSWSLARSNYTLGFWVSAICSSETCLSLLTLWSCWTSSLQRFEAPGCDSVRLQQALKQWCPTNRNSVPIDWWWCFSGSCLVLSLGC